MKNVWAKDMKEMTLFWRKTSDLMYNQKHRKKEKNKGAGEQEEEVGRKVEKKKRHSLYVISKARILENQSKPHW